MSVLPPAVHNPHQWLLSALAADSPTTHLTLLQVCITLQRKAAFRLYLVTLILLAEWEHWQECVCRRRLSQHRAGSSETPKSAGVATPPSPPPSGTPTYSAYTPIPPALITNVIVASSLNVIYTTCPAVLRTRTHNSDADQVSTMVDNGKQLIPFMISRMDHLVLCMRPVLRDHVYNGVVERLVRCHTHWHDPSLEVQQQFGLDSLLLDRTARRTLITVHRKLVNPWLCYMVDDYREINRRLLFVHHKMNEIHSRLAALHQ